MGPRVVDCPAGNEVLYAACGGHPLSGETSPYSGGRINLSMLSFRIMCKLFSAHLSPALAGERWWRQPPKGACRKGTSGFGCVSFFPPAILLNWPLPRPPLIRLRRTFPYSGDRISLSMLSFRIMCKLFSAHSAPALAGERWWRQPPKGACRKGSKRRVDGAFGPESS